MNTEILVIEDDDLVRQGIVDILELKGWNAVAAKSCSEALVRIRGEEYMLYVLDMKLPDGNGIMLCREIRRYTDNPILFLSAYDSEEFIVEGFEAGANDYVIKPFRTFEFIARIKALLRRTGMQNGKKVKKGIKSGEYELDLQKEKISIEKVRLSLLTIDSWQDIQRFLRNLDEGSLTKEEFEQGDFCILDLTELQEYDGKYLSAVSPDGQGISEDTVQVGDELPVYTLNENGSRNENPIPVTAILRGMKEEDVRNPQIGGSGISMIVGKNFWKKFGKSRIMEYDQIVKILVSDDADAYDTEGHILSILKQGTAVNVQNNHEEYKKIRQELYSFIGMYSIFAVFYMILISIVLYQMFLAEKQEEKREGEILQSLGMEEKFLKKMHRIEVLWMTGCAGVIGVLTLWGACRLI